MQLVSNGRGDILIDASFQFDVQQLKADHVKLQRLIKIARPVELPPLLAASATAAVQSTETKKKLVLPLFGKKGTFSFRSTLPAKKPKLVEDEQQITDGPEEEQDEKEQVEEESNSTNPPSPKVQAVKCETTTTHSTEEEPQAECTVSEEHTIVTEAVATTDANESESTKRKRKNRNRPRNRNRVHERMDYDDSEELADSTKYSGWVPPEDQAGDGFTDLNSKFGY